jgi:N-acetylglucosaminyl-diphospho-decaprenol L-rhamnosyltransferase
MTTTRPRVSIVIVTYNSKAYIDECLAPLVGNRDFEIIVVDNASPDGTAAYVSERYPALNLIASEKNLGFSGGNNLAFRMCTTETVLLLNPDAFIKDVSVIWRLQDALFEHSELAVVGPQLINIDGSHQVGDGGWKTGLLSIVGHAFWLHRLVAVVPSIYISHPTFLKKDFVDVDWICGACMMVRSSVIEEIGGLDESIFMYGEDVEWGERARTAGYKARYFPALKVLHIQGASQRQKGEEFFSTKWMDSRAKRYAKSATKLQYGLFKFLLSAGFGFRSAVLAAVSVVLRRPRLKRRAEVMLRYAAHAWKLPSNFGSP